MRGYREDDGGKQLSFSPNEQLDCTVRALAILSGEPYNVAHAFLRDNGRKDQSTFKFWTLHEKTFVGRKLVQELVPRRTVHNHIKDNPTGKYIISVRRHVFAVIDGVVHDSGPEGNLRRMHVRCVYKLVDV